MRTSTKGWQWLKTSTWDGLPPWPTFNTSEYTHSCLTSKVWGKGVGRNLVWDCHGNRVLIHGRIHYVSAVPHIQGGKEWKTGTEFNNRLPVPMVGMELSYLCNLFKIDWTSFYHLTELWRSERRCSFNPGSNFFVFWSRLFIVGKGRLLNTLITVQ